MASTAFAARRRMTRSSAEFRLALVCCLLFCVLLSWCSSSFDSRASIQVTELDTLRRAARCLGRDWHEGSPRSDPRSPCFGFVAQHEHCRTQDVNAPTARQFQHQVRDTPSSPRRAAVAGPLPKAVHAAPIHYNRTPEPVCVSSRSPLLADQ